MNLMTCGLIVVSVLLLNSMLNAQPSRPSVAPASRPAVHSPEVAADGRVTFRLWAPRAQSVVVLGVGPGGNSYESRSEMTRDDRGVWSVTTPPLAADIYSYSLSIDGVSILDPANPKLQTGFLSHQSQLHVPGRELWDRLPGVMHGAVTRHAYHSAVADDDRDFWVYTPPNYDPRRDEPYPVLYLLHGLGDGADAWLENGAANLILDNLIAQGKATPMIVVMPLGYGTSAGPLNGRKAQNIQGFSKALLDEVLPRVEKTYRVAAEPARRAIAGLSMGGAEATFVGLKHSELFATVGTFSGAFSLWPSGTTATTHPTFAAEKIADDLSGVDAAKIRLLFIACGSGDGLIDMNRQLNAWLSQRGVRHQYVETPDAGHVWSLWRRNLGEFVALLFR